MSDPLDGTTIGADQTVPVRFDSAPPDTSGLSSLGQPQTVQGPISHGSVWRLQAVMIPVAQPADVADARQAVGSPTGRLLRITTVAAPATWAFLIASSSACVTAT
jgi:hypothetical protein